MKALSVTIQMKATEKFFPVVLYIMLYQVVLESVNKILTCDHLSKNKITPHIQEPYFPVSRLVYYFAKENLWYNYFRILAMLSPHCTTLPAC